MDITQLTGFIGDSTSFQIPLTWAGTAFAPGETWALIFTAKHRASDSDDAAVFQKASNAGITASGSTATVATVPVDTADLPACVLHCDIQAQHLTTGEVRTVAYARLSLSRDVTRETTVSLPIYTTEEYVARGETGETGPAGATGATGPAGPAPSGTGFVKVSSGVLETPSATIAAADIADPENLVTNSRVNTAISSDKVATRSALRIANSKGCLIGDSTTASYAGQTALSSFLLSTAESSAGSTVTSLAVAGHTIAQQKAAWVADTNKAKYDWISILIGANDLDYTESAATALARYQDLIDTINSGKKSGAKVIVSAILPCKARLITLWGGTNGGTAYTKWQAMNTAILGGSGAITGVDYRIASASDLLNDGSGNLIYGYDTGDGIHETDGARKVIAGEIGKCLQLAGFWHAGTPTGYAPGSSVFGSTNFLSGSKAQLGATQTSVSATATVDMLSLGNSFGSNARGSTANIKLALYEYLTYKSGIGVHATGSDFINADSGQFGWWAGAVETMNLSGTGLLRPRLGTYCPVYANDAAADADATLRAGEFYRVTGSRAVYRKP